MNEQSDVERVRDYLLNGPFQLVTIEEISWAMNLAPLTVWNCMRELHRFDDRLICRTALTKFETVVYNALLFGMSKEEKE